MEEQDALKSALRGPINAPKGRSLRADVTRAQALSPLRLVVTIATAPISAVCVALGFYISASPFNETDALRDFVALTGCDAAIAVGAAPAKIGEPGYHLKNDPEGDGVACGVPALARPAPSRPAPSRPASSRPAPSREASREDSRAEVLQVGRSVLNRPEQALANTASGAKFIRP